MTKAHRVSDPWKSRLFKTSSQFVLTELHDCGFDKERQMHKLIECNIGTLFPGLKLLETEFREMARGELRPDTIAFDTTLDTFVVLEYKNRLNKEAVDQARTYLSSIKQYSGDLVLLHSKNMKCGPRDKKSFSWKKVYAIIMAPEFGHYQVFGADDDPNVELYEISMYDDHIMLVERVGGGHERTVTMVSTPSPGAEAALTQPQMISIKEWKVYRGAKPTHVAFPGKPIMEVGSWIDVHAEAIEWLIDAGKIDKYGQVTTKSGWILYTSDEAYTKKQLRTRKTRYGWFDCNRNVENHIADITKIFEHADVDMDFKIAVRPNEAGQQNKVGTPLAAIQYQKGMKCEGWLTRNGERKTRVDSWVGLLVAVMNEVNPREPIKGGDRWLVNHTPKHDNGKKFFAPKQLSNSMWLETGSKGPPYILKICNRFPVAKELGLELY